MVKTIIRKSKEEEVKERAINQLSKDSQDYLSEITKPSIRPTSFQLNKGEPSKNKISPLLLGAIGAQTYFHEDGELASAIAAQKQGIPFVVSSHSAYSLEEISDAVPDSELWFQAHLFKDRSLTKNFIQRAELSGYQAIILSISDDTVNLNADLLDKGITNFIVDPIFAKKNYKSSLTIKEQITQEYQDREITWEDIRYLQQFTTLPIYIYGDLTIDDVRSALRHQIDGLIFTNIPSSTTDLLAKVNTIVGDKLKVVIETDVETQENLNQYLLQGADAISIKMNYIYGLATSGVSGVERVIDELNA
ncbi:alpha-hydroxy-acid oxidizing protein [Gracilibacillus kekensis]|uniref:FMN-dependent dehydrogenase, includes L-lactate dehydrogenase and type II isopentenyl diphosphate isomerase n=1 Tax=Gracilibacillus kekensis TaxID=1027249 RepID=A0A1M7MV75_9BACI|nr:alpha-hydroxy-acid oxidizing protein [Gracilibacillus kekensis]SHM95058.1 FMN-dependent dehydrogenase, includes L-lactate dehydrogenase and type II isopentenyl diphosphate isomerase [Gracilibacillus kekensis]